MLLKDPSIQTSVHRVEKFIDEYSTPNWAKFNNKVQIAKTNIIEAVRFIIDCEELNKSIVLVPQGSYFGAMKLKDGDKSDYDCDAFYNGPSDNLRSTLKAMREKSCNDQLLHDLCSIDTSIFYLNEVSEFLQEHKSYIALKKLKKLAALSFMKDKDIIGNLEIAYQLRDFYWNGYKEVGVLSSFNPYRNAEMFYKEKVFGWGDTRYDNSIKAEARALRRLESIQISKQAIQEMRNKPYYNEHCDIIDMPKDIDFQNWSKAGLEKYS